MGSVLVKVRAAFPTVAVATSPGRERVTDRRSFLSAMTLGLAGAALPLSRGARPTVEAEPTVFRANPDGRLSLVRFYVREVDAPAGRLRVYDDRRRLLGTAGVIRAGDVLYGELWLPLERRTRIRSQLEAPGVQGVLRSEHSLRPKRRWTIHWITAAEPERLARQLQGMEPLARGLLAAQWAEGGVAGNPLAPLDTLELRDHLELLQMALPARDLEVQYQLPVSQMAVAPEGEQLIASALVALAGSGVPYVARPWHHGDPQFEWWIAPDGSRVLAVAVPHGAESGALGFAESAAEMSRRVEQWLETSPLLVAPGSSPEDRPSDGVAFVVDTEPAPGIGRMLEAVRDWNTRYAFPRIVIGPGDDLGTVIDRMRGSTTPVLYPSYHSHRSVPDLDGVTALADERRGAEQGRGAGVATMIAQLLDDERGSGAALQLLASEIDSELPGTLVLNPAPFHRTGVAEGPGGSLQTATDVPGLGYAFLVDAGGEAAVPALEEVPAAPPLTVLQARHVRLELDRESGAVRSLIASDGGREWVRPNGDGLNALPGSILERLERQRFPGVATRLVARRWSPARGNVRSTVTVYDDLPWIDIENESAPVGTSPMQYLFGFDAPEPHLMWEVPAGHEEATAPLRRVAHLRWVSLESQQGSVLFRGHDAPFVSVLDDGTLVSYGPRGRARYRLAVSSDPVSAATATRFGWGAEPFVTVRVDGGGSRRLPRYGGLVSVDQPGVAVLDVKRAWNGDGVIVFLQELMGSGRFVSLGSGLLSFEAAAAVDMLERETGEEATLVPGGVLSYLPPWGVTALRLTGLGLRA